MGTGELRNGPTGRVSDCLRARSSGIGSRLPFQIIVKSC